MTSTHPAPTPFDHRMAVYGADDEFVAAAVPFLAEGLGAPGEPPPVAIAAPDKLDLLRDALGGDAKSAVLVPHTEWYTGSAANAVAQGAGYLAAQAGPGGRIHLLMEPVWNGRAGRSVRESAEWIRYEALANLLFAPMATTALCAYDTRTAGTAVVEAARRAHPDTGVYEDPVRLTAELDSAPLPLPRSGPNWSGSRTPTPYAGRGRSGDWRPRTRSCSPRRSSPRPPRSAPSPTPGCGARHPPASANCAPHAGSRIRWPASSPRPHPNWNRTRGSGSPGRCAPTSTSGTTRRGRPYGFSTGNRSPRTGRKTGSPPRAPHARGGDPEHA